MPQSRMDARIAEISQSLDDFSREIAACFENSEWDGLLVILTSRQSYFEQILAEPVANEHRLALRELFEAVLVQDAEALSKIQQQKSQLMELNGVVEQGMRALKAYGGQ